MGKVEEEEQSLPRSEDPPRNAASECRWGRCSRKLVGGRCVLVLVLSVAVFLSAVFWLPPFLRLADRGSGGDSRFKGGVLWVAALFRGVRSVSVFGFEGNEVLVFLDLGRIAGEMSLFLSGGLDFIAERVEQLT